MLGLGGEYVLRLKNRPSVLLSLAKVVDDAGLAPYFVGQVAWLYTEAVYYEL